MKTLVLDIETSGLPPNVLIKWKGNKVIPKDALTLIDAIRATGKKLQPKDNGFISTVSIQAKQGRYLQPAQAKWLQDIYSKTMGGGIYQSKEFIR